MIDGKNNFPSNQKKLDKLTFLVYNKDIQKRDTALKDQHLEK